jgi:predicted ATPase
MNPSNTKQRLDALLADYRHAQRQAQEEQERLDSIRVKEASVLQAQKILQEVAESVQNAAHSRIAGVVTRCLKSVFGDSAYEFKIEFRQLRGKTEARLTFVRDGEEINPTGGAGGGVIDVASFALRLVCLMLSKPTKRRLLILDEPFRFVSKEFQSKVRELILTLAREMSVQFVVVSHDSQFRIGKIVELL